MTVDQPDIAPLVCDGCGHNVDKISRRYKGKAFCATCYKREFKKAICPKCGMLSRLYKKTSGALCISCENSGVPCVRCGKTEYQLGKVTEYGPVCNACSLYFRDKKQCDGCGKWSYGISRVSRFGGDKLLCPVCARADHATCPSCGRYRLLDISADGKKLCKKCRELGSFPCPTCGEMMPAGQGKECSTCYYKKLLHRRIDMNCASFLTTSMSDTFSLFGAWLMDEIGPSKAAITINRYLAFFLEMEKLWGEIPKDYSVLLKCYGPKGLRMRELPMRYLQRNGYMIVDESSKQEEAERRRIAALIEKSGNCKKLKDFYDNLVVKLDAGETSLRSIRLALMPATKLMRSVQDSGRLIPVQSDVIAYLKKSPGQRSAVSGFVVYLRNECGLKVFLPPKDGRAAKNKRRALEDELTQLLKYGGKGILFQRKLLGTALAFFHNLPKVVIKSYPLTDLGSTPGDSMSLVIRGITYWLPNTVKEVFKKSNTAS